MRQSRYYGLFHKVGRRWIRLYPKLAFHKEAAIRRFQSLLIGLHFRGKHVGLRPVIHERPWAA